MLSVKFLYDNYLDILADASLEVNCNADMNAVIILAVGALRAGSQIDVYCDGLFWEAKILKVGRTRLRYRFLHTGRHRECGWISKRDFLQTWRFPVRGDGDIWKAKLVAGCGGCRWMNTCN